MEKNQVDSRTRETKHLAREATSSSRSTNPGHLVLSAHLFLLHTLFREVERGTTDEAQIISLLGQMKDPEHSSQPLIPL